MNTPIERIRILGIDPGTRVVGFALLVAQSTQPRRPRDWWVADAGVIKTSESSPMPARLAEIHTAISNIIDELRPSHVAIEKSFHGVNSATAIKLGEARGALLSAVGICNIPILELSPAEVKKTIASNGGATKEQVYIALQALLGFDKKGLPYDVSDALAIAYAASNSIIISQLSISKSRSNLGAATRSVE